MALWPALWVLGPAEVLARIVAFTRETGGQPDEVGSFFFGQVGSDPRPALLSRQYAVPAQPVRDDRACAGSPSLGWRAARDPKRLRAGWLLVFALGFGLMMTLGPKKFDRYLLPIVPIAGRARERRLVALLDRFGCAGAPLDATRAGRWPSRPCWCGRSRRPTRIRSRYYNPLLGGGAVAQRTVMIGNGEGLDQAARWLADAARRGQPARVGPLLGHPGGADPCRRRAAPRGRPRRRRLHRDLRPAHPDASLGTIAGAVPGRESSRLHRLDQRHRVRPRPSWPASRPARRDRASRWPIRLPRGPARPRSGWRTSGRLAAALRVVGVGLAVFALAAVVRLWALDTYVTIDESRWVQRASDFWALIGQGNREDTFIIGHPGVTTMWTALLGMGPERARHFSFLEGRDDATRRDGYFEALIAARAAVRAGRGARCGGRDAARLAAARAGAGVRGRAASHLRAVPGSARARRAPGLRPDRLLGSGAAAPAWCSGRLAAPGRISCCRVWRPGWRS